MKSIIKWYHSDLKLRLMLGMRYCERILAAELDMFPHFAYGRDAANGEGFGFGSLQHAVGRGMDLIYNYEKYSGNKISPEIEAAYLRHFYAHLDPEYGMCMEQSEADGKWLMEPHNLRETIEALTLLLELRHDGRAYEEMQKIYRILELSTDEAGRRFDIGRSQENGVFDRYAPNIGAPQPCTAGRLTGPLTRWYKLTGDKQALKWARGFAFGTLDCFTEAGEMLESAGTHVHSMTSALSGAAEYAAFTGDEEIFARLIRIYENPRGLPLVMTDFGWIKEQICVEGQVQGEVNQIGDMTTFCLELADYDKDSKWFSRAETFMRSGVLPSQVLRHDFINPTPNPESDHRRDIPARILGGYGFPMPASHLENEGSPINTLDITQGANQAICRFMEKIVTVYCGMISVNLLFSTDTPDAKVISALPLKGEITVIPKKRGKLRIRIPENVDYTTISVDIDCTKADFTIEDGWILLAAQSYDVVNVTFELSRMTYHTYYIDTDYTVTKLGEQTISVTPIDGIYPLYDDSDFV